jgi:hypothetical protein
MQVPRRASWEGKSRLSRDGRKLRLMIRRGLPPSDEAGSDNHQIYLAEFVQLLCSYCGRCWTVGPTLGTKSRAPGNTRTGYRVRWLEVHAFPPAWGVRQGAFWVQRLAKFHVILILGTRSKTALR